MDGNKKGRHRKGVRDGRWLKTRPDIVPGYVHITDLRNKA